MANYKMITLINEVETLIELLRESLTNLTTTFELDPKNPQLQTNEIEDQKKTNQTKT